MTRFSARSAINISSSFSMSSKFVSLLFEFIVDRDCSMVLKYGALVVETTEWDMI